MTLGELAEKFKNPLLKNALLASAPEDTMAMSFVSAVAGMCAGDHGVPFGGSRAFAERIEKKFISLGGKIFFNSKAEKILVGDGKAVGIKLQGGKEARADYIVSAADAYNTFYALLDGKFTPPLYENLFSKPKEFKPVTGASVYLGIDIKIPFTARFLNAKGEKGNTLFVNYGYEPSAAPEGKTVLACRYDADYDFWKALRAEPKKYSAEKKKLVDFAVSEAEKIYPEIKGHIEVVDVVTPVTYERYCGSYRGSFMTWVGKRRKEVPTYFPGVLEGLKNFILAGMWALPPGGLPGASATGKFAAYRICKWEGVEFKA